MKKTDSDRRVLIASAIVVTLFVLFGIVMPKALETGANFLFKVLTEDFGWLYLIVVFLMVVFAFFLALSPLGKLKMGKEDDKPEYSNFQWFTMLFGGSMGIGLVFYSVAEPIMHYVDCPSAENETAAAMYEAMRLTFFHWGLHPWVIYAIGGLALGYFSFKKDKPFLVSSAFEPLIGDRVHGPIGVAIDVLAVFATIFGVATSLGLGAGQIVGGLAYIYGIKTGTMLTVLVIAAITVVFTFATMSGLQKGIALISDIKLYMSIAFMIFIFVFGGAVFILDLFTNTLGFYIASFVRQSLWMEDTGFLSGWTVFYWAWWLAWAPFCGQFCARVSKGRTIKEYLLTVSILPAFFSFIWLGIYGGAAFNLDETSGGAIVSAINSDYTTGLFALLSRMPIYAVTAPLAIALIVFSFLGSANSATYVLAMLTDKGNLDPGKKLRAGWGIAQGAVTIICILVGGESILKILQTTSIVAAFPYMIIMIIMCVSIYKALSEDAKKEGITK